MRERMITSNLLGCGRNVGSIRFGLDMYQFGITRLVKYQCKSLTTIVKDNICVQSAAEAEKDLWGIAINHS